MKSNRVLTPTWNLKSDGGLQSVTPSSNSLLLPEPQPFTLELNRPGAGVYMKKSTLIYLAVVVSMLTQAVWAKDIVHDAEYYILETQNGERWAAEDKQLDQRLAELKSKHGQQSEIDHQRWEQRGGRFTIDAFRDENVADESKRVKKSQKENAITDKPVQERTGSTGETRRVAFVVGHENLLRFLLEHPADGRVLFIRLTMQC
jgi:hypothetical protein